MLTPPRGAIFIKGSDILSPEMAPQGPILLRRYMPSGNVRRIRRRVLPVSVIWLFSAVVLGFLFLSPELFAPVSAGNRLLTISSTGSGEYVTISDDSDINLTVVPTASGALASVETDVTVKTSVATGYSLYLNMSAATGTNTLYNSSDTSSYISPASGTPSSPATLGTNQWGLLYPVRQTT
jgi:hypothetical protein